MAPNLLVKAAFVRGGIDNIKRDSEEKQLVRTDYILQNIFAYLIKDELKFDSIHATNTKEEVIFCELREVVDSFKLSYDFALRNLCSEIEVTESTICSSLLGIANELFCEGITWSRIVSLFVFVGEFTKHCLCQGVDRKIVDEIYECFCRLVKEKLKPWINDHDGWEGVKSLSKASRKHSNGELSDALDSSDTGWAKTFLHGTVRLIGTLAHLANQPF